ncbi:MAG: DUF3379 domain-containing protein [Gemmataceae bacterium]|nr:DUF3379 domain-containing protein [Gemmataceae bacterium]MDW8266657.1 hypothetical protein [Gemmataceae bacterium]
MDCRTARLFLAFVRPGASEFDAADAAALEEHLADCPECSLLAEHQTRSDAALHRAMNAVSVPEGLRERILQRLAASRRRRLWPAAVAAASLALAAALGYGLLLPSPVAFDLEHEVFHQSSQLGMEPEQVEQVLAAQGIATTLPRQFHYLSLIHFGLEEFHGQRVPFLLFLRDGEWARLYVVDQRHFDVQALMAQTRADSGGCTVEVIPGPPGTAYVVVYTGGSLARFLRAAPPAT